MVPRVCNYHEPPVVNCDPRRVAEASRLPPAPAERLHEVLGHVHDVDYIQAWAENSSYKGGNRAFQI